MNIFKKLLAFLLLATLSSAASAITDAQLFAYAEANYPSIFTGAATAGVIQPYNYRYYPASRNYLAVDTSGMIYILGPYTGDVVTAVVPVTAVAKIITAWQAWQATWAASVVNHFVAPDGNDSVDSGAFDKPYKTIDYCAKTARSGEVCQIRTGTYRETVRPNSGIIITAYKGEQVTVDGSDPVTGWTLVPGSTTIYSTSAALSAGDANQVFVGQKMMTEARWPNGDDLFHVNWAIASGVTGNTSRNTSTSITPPETAQLEDISLPLIKPNINCWLSQKQKFIFGAAPILGLRKRESLRDRKQAAD